ncbi:hypothetical protein YC2023_065794 [Brassica napus]
MVKDPIVTTGSGGKKVKIDNHHTAIELGNRISDVSGLVKTTMKMMEVLVQYSEQLAVLDQSPPPALTVRLGKMTHSEVELLPSISIYLRDLHIIKVWLYDSYVESRNNTA